MTNDKDRFNPKRDILHLVIVIPGCPSITPLWKRWRPQFLAVLHRSLRACLSVPPQRGTLGSDIVHELQGRAPEYETTSDEQFAATRLTDPAFAGSVSPYHSCYILAMARKILHLDMDCFYAAIEVRDHPELAGKPVAVGGARDQRGVLTTCNYEARKFGVHSAMPTFKALQKCPQLIVMPTRFDVYRRESNAIRQILLKFSPRMEPLSLDEAFLDLSPHPGEASAVAEIIRHLIFQKTSLTASAGVAPNKMLAKIASDWNKPNGQFEIREDQIEAFMVELPVRRLWGIGPKSAERLAKLGVHTCGDLQRYSRFQLFEEFGKFGPELYDLCRGIDARPVEPDRIRKSLSSERTFSQDLTSLAQCEAKLPELFEDVMTDLQQSEYADRVRTVFVKIRFADFSRTTVERAELPLTLESFTTLLREGLSRKKAHVRLLGLGVRFQEPALEPVQQLDLPWS